MIQPRNPNADDPDVPEVTMPTMALTPSPKPPGAPRMPAGAAEEAAPPAEASTDGFGTVSKGFKTGEVILKRYRVEGVLGQGGMGIVYKCLDTHTDLRVAVKTLPPALSTNPEEMEEIKDNYRLVERLHHPHIADAKNIERDESTGQYFLIMEFVDGINLRQYRKKNNNAVSIEEMVPIARMIASALDFGHSEQIIHRDIKPSNIMITSQGKVKLLDYGIASQYHESMSRVTQQKYKDSGTGPYMAPEQWTADYQDAKTDQYALAVVVYEMVTGNPPFMNPDPVILGQMVRKEPPRKPDNLSAQTWAVMCRALAKKRKDRFDNCTDFLAALDDSLNGLHSQASRKKARLGIFAAAAVLVLLLAAGIAQQSAERGRIATARANAGLLVERAGQLAANGELAEAEMLLERALEAAPGLESAASLLGRIEARGLLRITSTPSGAEVWVQDRRLGETPLQVEYLPGEVLPLVFKRDGYENVARTVRVAAREEQEISAALPGALPLRLRSAPAGATVWVNGEEKGQTPLDLAGLEPGTLTVRMLKEGFQPAEQSLRLPEDPAQVEFALLVIPPAPTATPFAVAAIPQPTALPSAPDTAGTITAPVATPVPNPAASTRASVVVVPALYAQGVRSAFWREFLEKHNVANPEALENPEFSAKVIDRLIQTRRFDVLERENLRDIIKELQWGDSEWADPSRVARVGKQLNAHYVVIPVIQKILFDLERREIPYTGMTQELLKGHLEAQIRVVETATRRIVSSQFLSHEAALKLPEPAKDFERRKALAQFVPDLYEAFALNAAARITDEVYPIRVLAVEGNEVTLNRGEGAILVGETLDVFTRGQALTDPDTGDAMGFQESKTGVVTVQRVMSRVSVARVTSGAVAAEQHCRRTQAPVPTPTPRPAPNLNW